MEAEMVEHVSTTAVPLAGPKIAPADTVSTKAAATGSRSEGPPPTNTSERHKGQDMRVCLFLNPAMGSRWTGYPEGAAQLTSTGLSVPVYCCATRKTMAVPATWSASKTRADAASAEPAARPALLPRGPSEELLLLLCLPSCACTLSRWPVASLWPGRQRP
eukprot:scaffold182833_cov41-Tisochrysis_lutea.AAC.2